MFDVTKQKTLSLSSFPFQTTDKVRYADTDRQGHVNNAVFNEYLETGRVEFLYLPDRPLYMSGCSFVIASSKIDYLKEIKWPGTVQIGAAVIRIGNSSMNLAESLFQEGQLVATAEVVIVQVDNATTRSHPLSPETKARLQKYMLSE